MSTTNPRQQALGGLRLGRPTPRTADGPARSSPVHRLGRGWQRLISPLLVLVVWQLLSAANVISQSKLPPPSRVWSTGLNLITENNPAYGTLQHALLVSLERIAIGFTLGGAVALVLAVIAGLSRVGENAIDPLMQMIRTLPLFGLVPVFIVWFGIGQLPKELLIALGAAVPLYLNAFAGIRGVDRRLHELGDVLKLSRGEQLRHIVVPGALPETLTGLRQSLGVAWLALVVAEQFNANAGLGFLINQGQQFNNNQVIFVALIVYTLLGLVTDWIVRMIERRALAWRQSSLTR